MLVLLIIGKNGLEKKDFKKSNAVAVKRDEKLFSKKIKSW
jgi:hypothetical protein